MSVQTDGLQTVTYTVRMTYWGSTTTHIATTDYHEALRHYRTLQMDLINCGSAGKPLLEWIEIAN